MITNCQGNYQSCLGNSKQFWCHGCYTDYSIWELENCHRQCYYLLLQPLGWLSLLCFVNLGLRPFFECLDCWCTFVLNDLSVLFYKIVLLLIACYCLLFHFYWCQRWRNGSTNFGGVSRRRSPDVQKLRGTTSRLQVENRELTYSVIVIIKRGKIVNIKSTSLILMMISCKYQKGKQLKASRNWSLCLNPETVSTIRINQEKHKRNETENISIKTRKIWGEINQGSNGKIWGNQGSNQERFEEKSIKQEKERIKRFSRSKSYPYSWE